MVLLPREFFALQCYRAYVMVTSNELKDEIPTWHQQLVNVRAYENLSDRVLISLEASNYYRRIIKGNVPELKVKSFRGSTRSNNQLRLLYSVSKPECEVVDIKSVHVINLGGGMDTKVVRIRQK